MTGTEPAGDTGTRQPRVAPRRGGALLGRIVLLSLLNGLLWAAIVPPWQAPDEPKHMEFIRLMRSGELIAFTTEEQAAEPELQREILASMDAHRFWWYGRAPGFDPESSDQAFGDLWQMGAGSALARTSPVYHWLLARIQPADLLAGLYLGRLVSVLLGALVVLLAGAAARELFPDDPFARYGAPLLLALLPMFAFVHSGVNNDVLVNVLGALAFLLMARLLSRGGSLARFLLLAAVVVAAVAVKRVAVVLVPAALLSMVLWRVGRARRPLAAAALWTVGIVAASLAAFWWWLGTGLAFLPEQWRGNLGQYFFNDPEQLGRIVAFLRTPGVAGVVTEYAWRVHDGFWGSFGWAVLEYPGWLYAVLGLLGLVAVAGAVRRVVGRSESMTARTGLVSAAALIVLTFGAAVAFFLGYLNLPYPVPPQGRYLFVAAVPVAVVLSAGWGAWVPERMRPRALLVLGLVTAAFDVAVLAAVGAWFYG